MEMTWVGMSVAVSRRWSKKCEPLSPLVSDRVGFFGTAGVRPHGWLFAQRKALLRGSWSEAGERFGVVNAPNRSQLPAVRAVSGFPHRGCKVAIFKPSGLRFPEKPLLRHCQRGCKQKWRCFRFSRTKSNLRFGSTRKLRSWWKNTTVKIIVIVRVPLLKKQYGSIAAIWLHRMQASSYPESLLMRWKGDWSSLGNGSVVWFTSWQYMWRPAVTSLPLIKRRTIPSWTACSADVTMMWPTPTVSSPSTRSFVFKRVTNRHGKAGAEV